MFSPIIIKEHCQIDEDKRDRIQDVEFVGNPDCLGEPKHLGIERNFTASYYIGADWLVKNEQAVVVLPKMENTDFIEMFVSALEVDSQHEASYFSKCYDIKFEEPAIELPKEMNQLTPLLILHFVSLLKKLTKHELKKGYVSKEENLKSKIKGKILFTKHLQQDVFPHREERTYCQYQEYTTDIPENRLLKKALAFSESIIRNYASFRDRYQNLKPQLYKLQSAFQNVSDDIQPYEVRKIATHKMFKEYSEAIRVAKMILRRFDYSLDNTDEENRQSPPFWIDMSRLYEMWVWDKLTKVSNHSINFQEDGFYGKQVADYVIQEERLILDAKYKELYKNNSSDIEDIRELSGNARDEKLLPNLPENYSPRCIILYPGDFNELKAENEILLCEQGQIINGYRNFYKISVPLPIIKS